VAGVLSDVVAAEAARLRRAAGLSRQQVAEQCAQKGLPGFTAASLANIETGRRDPEGRRRREVSVDELVVLAEVLNIPPVLLVFPVGSQATTEYPPSGGDVVTWEAARWFGGMSDFSPLVKIRTDGTEVPRVARMAIRTYDEHETMYRQLLEAVSNERSIRRRVDRGENGDASDLLQSAEQLVAQRRTMLQDLRAFMEREGIAPPEFTDRAAELLGLTPEAPS
jgi:transcriptional regulator with XRE-family HTH domain